MKILIAASSSVNFESTISYLEKHSWTPQTEFRLLHIVEPSDITDLWLSLSGATRSRQLLAERQLEAQTQSSCTEKECLNAIGDAMQIESRILLGHIDEVLIREAQSWNADVVIVGLPEASIFGRFVEGGMLSRVVAEAPCPVIFSRKQRRKSSRKSA